MKKVLLLALFIIFSTKISFADELVDEKFKNIINEWEFHDFSSNSYILLGNTSLGAYISFDNCKEDTCNYNILIEYLGGHREKIFNYSGKAEIENEKNILLKNINNIENCNIKVELSNDYKILKMINNPEICDITKTIYQNKNINNFEYKTKISGNERKIYLTSFKCENLNSITDVATCSNIKLANFDMKLDKLYKDLLKNYEDNEEITLLIKQEQDKWIKEKNEIKNNLLYKLSRKYYDRMEELGKRISHCGRVERSINLIISEPEKAKKNFLLCINGYNVSGEKSIEKQKNSARLYLSYILLSENNQESNKEANKMIKTTIQNMFKYCNDYDNFCAVFKNKKDKIIDKKYNNQDQLIEIMLLTGSCFTYDMIIKNPNILNSIGSYFKSNRDNYIGGFCGEINKPYKNITTNTKIKTLFSKTDYKKYIKSLGGDYATRGSLKFGMIKEAQKFNLGASLTPNTFLKDFDDLNIYIEKFPKTETDEKYYFSTIELELTKYPELQKLINSSITEVRNYYETVFKINRKIAEKYAKIAVQKIILYNIYYE